MKQNVNKKNHFFIKLTKIIANLFENFIFLNNLKLTKNLLII